MATVRIDCHSSLLQLVAGSWSAFLAVGQEEAASFHHRAVVGDVVAANKVYSGTLCVCCCVQLADCYCEMKPVRACLCCCCLNLNLKVVESDAGHWVHSIVAVAVGVLAGQLELTIVVAAMV